MKKIAYSKQSIRTLRKMQPKQAERITAKIKAYANGEPVDIKAMQGSADLLRIRVGDWRVILTDDGTIIDIIKIAPRGKIYKN